MIRKLMICPFFGELPRWMPQFLANFGRNLSPYGYDLVIDQDEDAFRRRVSEQLGIMCPPMYGTGKIWDYRPALGHLYEEELRDYEWWGHCDFDVVFGRVERFVTEEFLSEIDMHSNCRAYVNGSWSLYRNDLKMRRLFQDENDWIERLEDPVPSGWCEVEFSKIVEADPEVRHAWTQWQVFEEADLGLLHLAADGTLTCGSEWDEVMMAHFRRTKVYPGGCLV